jgi:isopenicillin N synthase-like dioxygenase
MSSKVLTTVPIVDIGPFLTGNAEDKAAVAATVDRTNREIGFLVITGHGFDLDLLARWFSVSKEFFEADQSVKESVAAPPGEQQGYHRLAQSGLAAKEGQMAPPDLREYFMVGPMDLSGSLDQTAEAAHDLTPNRWPAENPALREVGEAYYTSVRKLGGQLMRIFAVGLGLPEDWFEDKIDHQFSILSSIYYPAQDQPPQPGQLRAGAHTDYGSLTILAPTDAPGGLQVKTLDGEWVDVPYVPGGFVVNIGDMMQRWTNGRWRSNMHRVINPPICPSISKPRQSIAYFLHPNHDAVIECIPTCLLPGEEPKHAPITAGVYMREKEAAIDNQR